MIVSRHFRIDLGYDGGSYFGWQAQEGQRTIQGVLEKALASLVKTPVKLSVAGRTDTGVHARWQTAAFSAATRMQPCQIKTALHSELPRSVRIHRVMEVPEEFHPRRSAIARIYEYILDPRPRSEPWRESYVWACPKALSLPRMEAMAALILGERDFTGFCSAQDPSPHKRRYIFQSHWRQDRGDWVYRVTGNAFLWRMVRRLVGAMVRLSREPDGVATFERLLVSPEGVRTPPPAPASGLYLHKVVYHADDFAF